ncbi:MAG TPA: hypothetical protein VFH45_06180, partial [Acidimicrobiales bacterium]|nr:hypothetical protein [Acidimicrobiales bacterium]
MVGRALKLRPRLLRGRALHIWKLGLVVTALAVAAVAAATGAPVRQSPAFGPLDELAHFDYVHGLAHGGVPRFGDMLSGDSLHLAECVGNGGPRQGPCATSMSGIRVNARGYS